MARELTIGHLRHDGAPPCRHGWHRARRGVEDVQPIPRSDARVDGGRVGTLAIARNLIGDELSPINGGVPAVTHGNSVPMTRAPPVSGSG